MNMSKLTDKLARLSIDITEFLENNDFGTSLGEESKIEELFLAIDYAIASDVVSTVRGDNS